LNEISIFFKLWKSLGFGSYTVSNSKKIKYRRSTIKLLFV